MLNDLHPNIYLITGKVQEGKTTFLSELVEQLKKEELRITGFLSRGFFANGERTGFTLENLNTGEQVPMATVEEREGWLKFRRFYFNPMAFKLGEKWVSSGLSQRPDLVVIDEVGPLELEEKGWWNVLKVLEGRVDVMQLWIVRDQSIPAVKKKWNIYEENIFLIKSTDPSKLSETLRRKLINDEANNYQSDDASN